MTRHLPRRIAGALARLLGLRIERVGGDFVWLRRAIDDQQRQVDFTDWLAARHLSDLLRRLHVEIVIDVGANTGQFGHALRLAGWRGRLVSFEPDPTPREVLSARATADGAWEVHPIALSDRDGATELTLRAASTLTSLRRVRDADGILDPAMHRAQLSPVASVRVELRRLDSIWSELHLPTEPGRVFLKMDTQGSDDAVLEGARAVWPLLAGLQTELAVQHMYEGVPDYRDRLGRIESAGFLPSGFYDVVTSRSTGLLGEFDGIFLRVEGEPGRTGTARP